MTTLVFEQQRAFDDLLMAERQLRAQSESQVRELRQLLIDTAFRLDGERLEAVRREDPSVPGSWKVSDWSAFLKNMPNEKGWGASVVPSNAPTDREKELLQQVGLLKSQLEEAFQQLEAERERAESSSKTIVEMIGAKQKLNTFTDNTALDVVGKENIQLPKDVALGSEAVSQGKTPMLTYIIEDVKGILKDLPKRPPAAFKKFLDGGNRVGGDLDTIFPRYWVVLYLIGRWRLCASLEIDNVLADVEGISARSGSLKRILVDLADAGMLVGQKMTMSTPQTVLTVNRLSESGEALYMELFKEKPLEDDWSKLIRLHGDAHPEHSLAILFFGMHARKCGWMTEVLPSDGYQNTDVWIGKGSQSHYVDVELERSETWRSLTKLNVGGVALCTGTADLRQRLSGDCKLDKVPGMATDIETLVQMKYKTMNNATHLWVETW